MLKQISGDNQIAMMTEALVLLDERKAMAIELLNSAIEMDPASLEAEYARDILEDNTDDGDRVLAGSFLAADDGGRRVDSNIDKLWGTAADKQDRDVPVCLVGFQRVCRGQAATVHAVGRYTTQWEFLTGAAFLAILPIIVLFLMIEKQLVAGIVGGAVKG